MGIKREISIAIFNIFKHNKKNVSYLVYYSLLEGILILSIPLASSFIINSIISHASISVVVLGIIVLFMFFLITFLRILQGYIIEKFEQKVFVENAFDVAQKAFLIEGKEDETTIKKVMNYFFDITVVQKFFPVFMLNGVALLVQIIISFILLFAFHIVLFELGVIAFLIYIAILLLLGSNGIRYAIERSDTKHENIFFLQQIPFFKKDLNSVLRTLDEKLERYVDARRRLFRVIIRQQAFSYLMQGAIISGFFIIGAYLTINGKIPIGEFVASEIVVISITNAIYRFIRQLEYIYEVAEGFYKVGKLMKTLSKDKDE